MLDRSIISITEVINDEVSFNTKKDPLGYTLTDKTAYRNYLYYKKKKQEEKEKEIIKRMKETK